jgi:arylsulfatase A-like enzyme
LGLIITVRATRQGTPTAHHNVIVFVADGLRHGSVNERDTPALWRVRTQGVHFENSYAVFPTFTMANASAIATGHGLGDTGIYSNTIRTGYSVYDTGNFNLLPGTPVPFIENDQILADLDDHASGNALPFESFLALARAHGYRTAAIGKVGPTALQDVTAVAPQMRQFPPTPSGVVIDDATGSSAGLPIPQAFARSMTVDGVPTASPTRTNGFDATSPFSNGNAGGTLAANTVQQDWFIDVATKYALPSMTRDPTQPFALLFWSRDPDGTQHNNGDQIGSLAPGINGPTSLRGVRNADRALQRILDWLDANPTVRDNTDLVVTSDHGFATISRTEISRTGQLTTAESAKHDYVNAAGAIDTLRGTLPLGCLALDLAYDLQWNVFDPDQRVTGGRLFRKVRMGSSASTTPTTTWEHPANGNALLGGDVQKADGTDASVIVAANGGSDLIYIPDGNRDTVRRVVARALSYDYVSGVFVDDAFGDVPGALPLSSINLTGNGKLPRPAAVVNFKVFYLNPDDLQTGVQLADTSLQEGQGMHGGFGRESTFNNMAAMGPDFKRAFIDTAPVGNGDIAPTIARLLGFDLPAGGDRRGRVLTEALASGPAADAPALRVERSAPVGDRQTVLVTQTLWTVRYLARGCTALSTTRDADVCR